MIDRDIHTARALLVEGSRLLRSVTTGQLRDAGVGQVTSVARLRDARMQLEQQHYDIVVCNREFEDSSESGQDLLEELRREHLLPHSTVFLMVTNEAAYHQVVEAAESDLDGLLVRPYTAATLCQRIFDARQRKRELADVLKALDAGQTEVAFARALKRFQDQAPYAGWCGRLAAELLLDMDRPEDARRVFERLHATKPSPWSLLGAARATAAHGDTAAAHGKLNEVLKLSPSCADAHELRGRLLLQAGDFDAALSAYRAAAEFSPGCLLRNQQAGTLAFYRGQKPEARRWLERTLNLGSQSKLFDAASLLLLAMLRHDDQDVKGVAVAGEQLRRCTEALPESVRLRRLAAAGAVLVQLSSGTQTAARDSLAELSAEAAQEDFDFEAGQWLLALWSRMPAAERQLPAHARAVTDVALRFCITKATADVLAAAAQRAEPALGLIRNGQAEVQSLAEQAMSLALKGDVASAVQRLLAEGERTLNAKLLEMASAVARRHEASLPGAAALIERAAACLRSSCHPVAQQTGLQRPGRSPGGLQVRQRAVA